MPAQTSEANSPPPIDLAVGRIEPLPPELQARLHPIQRKMRSIVGLLIFVCVAFFTVTIPVIGIPPIIFFLEYLGAIPHQWSRRFFDLCTGYWICMMTVSLLIIELPLLQVPGKVLCM
jgi:hypothetical protein